MCDVVRMALLSYISPPKKLGELYTELVAA